MRVSKTGESKSETIGIAVTPTENADLKKLADDTDRSVSYWAGKFMRDGWANYLRDQSGGGGEEGGGGGGNQGIPMGAPSTVKWISKKLGRKKSSKKRESA